MNYYNEVTTEIEYLTQFYTLEEILEYAQTDLELIRELYLATQPQDVEIGSLLGDTSSHDYYYMVSSPDGWVPVLDCVEKTKDEMYAVEIEGKTIKASHDHLFQKPDNSWWYARDLVEGDELITANGSSKITNIIPYKEQTLVYDLSVNHDNHRYYTEGVCSHNTGKSLFLQNVANTYWKQGKNVIYFTLELHPELCARRMDAMNLDITTENLYDNIDVTDNAIKKLANNAGKMRIVYMNSGAKTSEIKAFVEDYEQTTGINVDAVCVDYLDLLTPVTKVSLGDTFHKDKFVSEELRNMGQELNFIVITASQANRCLLLNTKIEVKNKGIIEIKDVQIGDRIRNDIGYNTVIDKTIPSKQKVFKITTKSGDTVTCSDRHIFPTNNGEKTISNGLQVGDMLTIDNGVYNSGYITSIEYVGIEETIDISTDGNNLFFANSILTHNSGVTAATDDMNHTHIAGGISKINTADLVLGIITDPTRKAAGVYELQALKVRNGMGTGRRIRLRYNEFSMRIDDDPEFLKDLNQYGSMGFNKTVLSNSEKMMNQIQNTLNSNSKEYTPVDIETGKIIPSDIKGDHLGMDKLSRLNSMLNDDDYN